MDMMGGGWMHEYPPEDERPHAPGPQDSWQESVVLLWWDARNAVGGYFRIGHEPNLNGGEAVLWTAIFTPDGTFFRNAERPLVAADQSHNGLAADKGAASYQHDDHCIWRIQEPGIDLTLDVEDFHVAIDGYLRDGGRHIAGIQSNHVEVSCRVTGHLAIQGKEFEIDGLAMRDHGWGPRDWKSMLAHRWTVGTFDRENSFCALTMHLSDDRIAKFGWVVRGDKVIYADKVDIVAYLACDSVSNVGGKTLMTLSTGEKYELRFDPLAPAALFNRHGVCCVDTICRVTWGDKIGYGVFESSSNLQAGQRLPKVLDGGIATDGWHPKNPDAG